MSKSVNDFKECYETTVVKTTSNIVAHTRKHQRKYCKGQPALPFVFLLTKEIIRTICVLHSKKQANILTNID